MKTTLKATGYMHYYIFAVKMKLSLFFVCYGQNGVVVGRNIKISVALYITLLKETFYWTSQADVKILLLV